MEAPTTDLLDYEEIVDNLTKKLDGLSRVHQGLSDAVASLVAVHHELEDAKHDIASLSTSGKETLDEVRRLRPAELASTLNSSLTDLTRDMAESLGALSERLSALGQEVATTRAAGEARFDKIAQQLASQNERIPDQLSTLERSVVSSVTAAKVEITGCLANAQQSNNNALTGLLQRQDAIASMLTSIRQQQTDLDTKYNNLAKILIAMQQQQIDVLQHVSGTSRTTAAIRDIANSVQERTLEINENTKGLAPVLASVSENVRTDLSSRIASVYRAQLAWLIIVLIATIALAWSTIRG